MTGQEAEKGHGSMVLLDVGTACHALLDSACTSPSLEDAGFYNACSSRCEAHTFPGVRPMGQRRCRICKKRPVWKGGDVKNPGPVCKKCYHKHVWRERTAQAKAREEEPIKRRSRPQTPWPSPAGPVSSGEELLAWFEEPPEDLASSLCDTALMAVRDHWALVVSIIRDQSTSTQMIERALDGLLEYCYDPEAQQIYKVLCRYYHVIAPHASVARVCSYRKMWAADPLAE